MGSRTPLLKCMGSAKPINSMPTRSLQYYFYRQNLDHSKLLRNLRIFSVFLFECKLQKVILKIFWDTFKDQRLISWKNLPYSRRENTWSLLKMLNLSSFEYLLSWLSKWNLTTAAKCQFQEGVVKSKGANLLPNRKGQYIYSVSCQTFPLLVSS